MQLVFELTIMFVLSLTKCWAAAVWCHSRVLLAFDSWWLFATCRRL